MATAAKASAKVVPIDEAAATKKNTRTILIVVLAALLGAGGAGGAWFFLKQDDAAQAAQPAPPEPARPPVFLAMEPFTVNLQPEMGEQYLQIGVTLQLSDEKQVEQVKLYMPLVRSRILMLLAGKKGSELSTQEGKEKLQSEIADMVRKPFTAGGTTQVVNAVLFTSFVIQ